jgi:hypothetical protein
MNPRSTKAQIEKGVKGNATYKRQALERLIIEGYVTVESGKGGWPVHVLEDMFNEDQQETL